jgi:hypothetical protein
MRRLIVKLLGGASDQGLQSLSVMISLFILWMTLQKTIVDAFASPDADDWKDVVRSEMDLILSNETWELVDRPCGCKPMGCKWVKVP